MLRGSGSQASHLLAGVGLQPSTGAWARPGRPRGYTKVNVALPPGICEYSFLKLGLCDKRHPSPSCPRGPSGWEDGSCRCSRGPACKDGAGRALRRTSLLARPQEYRGED